MVKVLRHKRRICFYTASASFVIFPRQLLNIMCTSIFIHWMDAGTSGLLEELFYWRSNFLLIMSRLHIKIQISGFWRHALELSLNMCVCMRSMFCGTETGITRFLKKYPLILLSICFAFFSDCTVTILFNPTPHKCFSVDLLVCFQCLTSLFCFVFLAFCFQPVPNVNPSGL